MRRAATLCKASDGALDAHHSICSRCSHCFALDLAASPVVRSLPGKLRMSSQAHAVQSARNHGCPRFLRVIHDDTNVGAGRRARTLGVAFRIAAAGLRPRACRYALPKRKVCSRVRIAPIWQSLGPSTWRVALLWQIEWRPMAAGGLRGEGSARMAGLCRRPGITLQANPAREQESPYEEGTGAF